ncbi:MAG: TIGR03936 family radical SAM-associated protein [Oscillospiraceae bacterium]|nr:TIGR03936 family radical SAM-associated protein [Oscillospiraceae bacterium]MBR4691325.1 TIGR03936 family radical SAM-associated protein [Oscillospiraceae bacterium]
MPELRFRFEKRGRSAFLSHLDVMRTFQRAFVRAEIGVRHSEGFNPHPKMSIALPLQLGCESVCEVLDVSVLEGPADMTSALNAALPEGLHVLSASLQERPVREIAWAEWRISLPSEGDAEEAERILRFPSLPVEKKTKRGLGTLDIAPHVQLLSREGRDLLLRLRADSPVVNTGDVRKALAAGLGSEPRMKSLRLRLLRADGETFQ